MMDSPEGTVRSSNSFELDNVLVVLQPAFGVDSDDSYPLIGSKSAML